MAAAAVLGTAWLATPHAIPLYDGIGVPDEPYRYVQPPAGYQKTPLPSKASVTIPASGGTNSGSGVLVQTSEQSSQSGLFVIPKSFTAPVTTKSFTVTITPEAPDGVTPGGAPDGNVYRIEVLADGKTEAGLNSTNGTSVDYTQRATSPKIATAALYFRPLGGSWRTLEVAKSGTDSFGAIFAGPGDYALVATKSASSSSSHTLVIVILVLVVVAMAGAVLLIRVSRRATSAP